MRELKLLWQVGKSLVLIGLSIGGLVWISGDWSQDVRRRKQATQGVETQGRVTALTRLAPHSDRWSVAYTFTDAKGKRVDIAERRVPESSGAFQGNNIRVWYDPANPQDCVTDPELRYKAFGALGPLGITIFLAVGIVAGIVLFVMFVRGLMRPAPREVASSGA